MYLTKHASPTGARWAVDGRYTTERFVLADLLQYPADATAAVAAGLPLFGEAVHTTLAPVDDDHEVWASGVTYLRSRDAREAESAGSNVYNKVYDAVRPELFLKAIGRRAVGPGSGVRIRPDSQWNVPEPELVLVVNRWIEIVGYTAGNDVSSRDIEGENPLYLPQAKVYDRSCALGPGVVLAGADELGDLPITLRVVRGGVEAFAGETTTSQMRRGLEELVEYLGRDLAFPDGALLMTGTGIVPDDSFKLQPGDEVEVAVAELVLKNTVE